MCDFLDNDCDGDVDNDAIDADTWYSDADGDGYGEDGSGGLNCQQPANTADVDGDCDDDDEDVVRALTSFAMKLTTTVMVKLMKPTLSMPIFGTAMRTVTGMETTIRPRHLVRIARS